MNTKQSWLLILILVFGLFLSGCGLSATPTDVDTQLTQVMQNVQSTLTQIAVQTQYVSPQPTATNTAVPPTNTPMPEPIATQTPMPTPTQTPRSTVEAAPMMPDARITFGTYASRIMVVGMVKANTTQRYIFNGTAGQLVDIVLSSTQACSLSVSGKDGTVLVNSLSEDRHIQGNLTSTQDWYIDITPGGSNIDFVLYLTLP